MQLYEQTMDAQEGVVYFLLEEMAQQRIKENLLAYALLLIRGETLIQQSGLPITFILVEKVVFGALSKSFKTVDLKGVFLQTLLLTTRLFWRGREVLTKLGRHARGLAHSKRRPR